MGEKVNVVYGETIVQPGLNAGVRSTGRATLEEIGEIGKAIWKEVRESKVAAADVDGNRRLLARIRDEFKDFAESFPLVLRWIVEQRMFSRKALDHYLRLHAAKKLESRTDFLELQAEYVVNCWREKNPRQGAKGAARFRKQVCDQLLEEDKQFTEAAEAAKKEADALKIESRKSILAEISRLATAIHCEGGAAAYRGGPETPEAAAYRAALAAKFTQDAQDAQDTQDTQDTQDAQDALGGDTQAALGGDTQATQDTQAALGGDTQAALGGDTQATQDTQDTQDTQAALGGDAQASQAV